MLDIEDEIIKTKNVKQAIETFASDNFIPLAECDFTIKHVDTYIKNNTTTDFELFSKDVQKQYHDKKRILNEHIEFQQIYTIAAKKMTECTVKLIYEIDFSKYFTHPKIILSPKSIIPYKLHKPKELLNVLYKEINKIKVYNGILIHIFDEDMIRSLKILVKYIYAGKFVKKVRIPLFNGIEPVVTKESKLIFWFKEKEHKSQIIEVQENELLIEYKKPTYGQNGLNAFGEYIESGISNNVEDLHAQIDKHSIRIEEDENSKKYIAKHKGYVHFDGKTLSVDNKIKISEISRNNESIVTGEDNNIEVIVSQHDITRDSIGEGVELVSETIHVDGFVGAGSILEAINLNIEGATHQDSTQFARFAKINRHKGVLRCHNAKIALLEGGEVHASSVDIEASLGGSIYAQNVKIGHVKSNLKVYASNSIKIRLVSGEDNTFKINYRDIPIVNSKLELIDEDIDNLKYELEEAKRHNLSKVDTIKNKIYTLKNEKLNIQNSYKNATISIEQSFHGLNNIIFTIDEKNEIIFKTEAKQYDTFYIEVNENKITLHPVEKSITIK
jgi:hypothetical protein